MYFVRIVKYIEDDIFHPKKINIEDGGACRYIFGIFQFYPTISINFLDCNLPLPVVRNHVIF